MSSGEWYEVWRGYRHGEYVKGKGYYSINTDTWSNNVPKHTEYPIVNRYQFREYDDLEIESCYGYAFVDRIGFFLSVLLDGMRGNKNRAVHINVNRLQKILGENYWSRIVEMLEDDGVIESHRSPLRHPNRRKGLMYHRYALTEKMFESEIVERRIYHHMLLKNLYRFEDGINMEGEKAYQYGVVDRLQFEEGVSDLDVASILKHSKSSYSFEEEEMRTPRIYTPWNRLKKELRNKALLDGEELVEYDMQSAHFALLYHLQNEIKEGRKVRGLSDDENKRLRKFEVGSQWLDLFSESFGGSSDFYRTIGVRLMGMPFGKVEGGRDQIKDAVIRDLFGVNETSSVIQLGEREVDREVFRERVYGDSLHWIESVKSNKVLDKYQGGGYYINMSLVLQKVEVAVMGEVWRRLREINIDYLSIHDAISVKDSNSNAVEEVLRVVERQWKGIRFGRKK